MYLGYAVTLLKEREYVNERICPKCYTRTSLRAAFCERCGTSLHKAGPTQVIEAQPKPELTPLQQAAPEYVYTPQAPVIRPDRKSPEIAALLSLIIVGLGQMYLGKWWRGLGFIVLAPLVFLGTIWMLGAGVILVWIAAPIDAYMQAKKRNQRYGYPE